MHPGYFAGIGASVGALIYISGWLYIGALYLKWWICDEEGVRYNKTQLAKWNHKTFGFGDPNEFGAEWLAVCFISTIILGILGGLSYIPIARTIVFAIGGITSFIFVGSHTLRWAMRTKKAVDKVKNLSHKH